MFKLREEINKTQLLEILRQKQIYHFLNSNLQAKHSFEKLTASILNLPIYDVSFVSNIYHNFPLNEIQNFNEEEILTKYESKLREISKMPVNLKQTTIFPLQFMINDNFKLKENILTINKTSVMSSLYEFEKMIFNNEILYEFITLKTFSYYLYKNLTNFIKNHPTNSEFQQKMLEVLTEIGNDNELSMEMFGSNTIKFYGKPIDVSFIPNYPIKKLYNPILSVNLIEQTDKIKILKYIEEINLDTIDLIPSEFINFFKIFPFKKGIYIKPNGTKLYLYTPFPKNQTVENTLIAICNTNELNTAIYSLSSNESVNDLITYAVHTDNFTHQGIVLLALRKILGNYLFLENQQIFLPFMKDVLSWIKLKCEQTDQIFLPKKNIEQNVDLYVSLIQKISRQAMSKIDVSFLISKYFIPEIYLRTVFEKLTNDLEKYIFCSFILQNYNKYSIQKFQNQLSVKFPQTSNQFQEDEFKSMESKLTVLKTNSQKFIDLVNVNDLNKKISFIESFRLYEFSNVQLNQLCKFNTTQLTNWQKAIFLSLLV